MVRFNYKRLDALLVLPVLLVLALVLTLPGKAEAVHREKDEFIRTNISANFHHESGVWLNVNASLNDRDGADSGFANVNVFDGTVGEFGEGCGFGQDLFDENGGALPGLVMSSDIDAGTVTLAGTVALEGDCGFNQVVLDLTWTTTGVVSKFRYTNTTLEQTCRARGKGYDSELTGSWAINPAGPAVTLENTNVNFATWSCVSQQRHKI